MSGLLYYLPDRKHVTIGEMRELGIGYAFERDCTPRQSMAGPDEQAGGVVAADAQRVKRIGYYPKEQTWRKIPGNPAGAWVGRYNDQPIEPADLARTETLPGHHVRLADGRQWVVPIARGLAERDDGVLAAYCAAPQTMALDEAGRWTPGDVVQRYAALWQIATAWWDVVVAATDGAPAGETAIRFDFEGIAGAAVEVLAVNYRLAAAEVALLGLLWAGVAGEGTAKEILMATIDWPTMEAWMEKDAKKNDQTSAAAD